MSNFDFSFTLLLENGASCCSVSDRGENSFGILKQCQSPGRALSRVGGGGEGGISHPRLCAGAGERSRGPSEDSLQYFSTD